MFNEEQKNKVLNKLLKSQTFSKTTTSSVLLKLLVKATLENKTLSAYTIGSELFGKKIDPEKIEVNTRASVYNLRKKINNYYATEGAKDSIKIKIESGSYKVIFSSNENSDTQKKNNLFYTIGISSFAVFAILLGIYFLSFRNKNTLWTPLFDNNKPTSLYLGEVFGYFGKTAFSDRGWIRDFQINSSKDFYEQARKSPEKYANYKPADYHYVVFENAAVIKPFTKYFTQHNKDFNLGLSSTYKTKELKDKNTIYAGPLFVNPNFKELFNNLSKNIKIQTKNIQNKHYALAYKKPSVGKDTLIQFRAHSTIEHAIVAGFKGPNNTRHYLFFSNHGMGLNAVVDYFTQQKTLEKFTKNYLKKSEEFVSLFKVKGKDRTSINVDLVLFDDNR